MIKSFALLILIGSFSCTYVDKDNFLSLETNKVKVSKEAPFNHLPRNLNIVGDSIIFLNREQNSITIYNGKGDFVSTIKLNAVPVDKLYDLTRKVLTDKIIGYDEIAEDDYFLNGLKFESIFMGKIKEVLPVVFSLSYPIKGTYELNGEVVAARSWYRQYFLLNLNLTTETFDYFYCISLGDKVDSIGLNLMSSFIVKENTCLFPLISKSIDGEFSNYGVFERDNNQVYHLKKQYSFELNEQNLRDELGYMQHLWPICPKKNWFWDGLNQIEFDENSELVLQSTSEKKNKRKSHVWFMKDELKVALEGDIYGLFESTTDSISLKYVTKKGVIQEFPFAIKEISGLVVNQKNEAYFFTKNAEQEIFVNNFNVE